MSDRKVCGACMDRPVRAVGQYYCHGCQRARDNASASARRYELKRLREEVKGLRRMVGRIREALKEVES